MTYFESHRWQVTWSPGTPSCCVTSSGLTGSCGLLNTAVPLLLARCLGPGSTDCSTLITAFLQCRWHKQDIDSCDILVTLRTRKGKLTTHGGPCTADVTKICPCCLSVCCRDLSLLSLTTTGHCG